MILLLFVDELVDAVILTDWATLVAKKIYVRSEPDTANDDAGWVLALMGLRWRFCPKKKHNNMNIYL